MQQNTEQGYSLIELIITIAILGIFATTAFPSYQQYLLKAQLVNLISVVQERQNGIAEYINTVGNNCPNTTFISPVTTLITNNLLTSGETICNNTAFMAIGQQTNLVDGTFIIIRSQANVKPDGSIEWQCSYQGAGPTLTPGTLQNIMPMGCQPA